MCVLFDALLGLTMCAFRVYEERTSAGMHSLGEVTPKLQMQIIFLTGVTDGPHYGP